MTTMTTSEALPDAGLCRWCPHGQWSHKRGKGGCRELDCTCDKYAVDPVAQQAEQERVLTVVAEVCEGRAAKARTELAEIRGEVDTDPETCCPGEPVPGYDPRGLHSEDCPAYLAQMERLEARYDKPQPVDEPQPVPAPLVDPSTPLTHAEALALDELDRARDALRRAGCSLEEVSGDIAPLIDRLNTEAREAIRDLGTETARLRAQRDQLTTELAEERAEHQATGALQRAAATRVDELTVELDESQFQRGIALDALRRSGAQRKVLFQYDARQCTTEGCGSRYTVDVDHEHPLTPVTVMVVAREVPA